MDATDQAKKRNEKVKREGQAFRYIGHCANLLPEELQTELYRVLDSW
jgi:hypothetical protein